MAKSSMYAKAKVVDSSLGLSLLWSKCNIGAGSWYSMPKKAKRGMSAFK